jgi:biopolymer transport protein ExbD
MKKRILLLLVSFFAMTAMWASLVDAYQIYVTAAANGKTNATAVLTLNMKNRDAIATWKCTVELPAGVTYVDGSAALVDGRYPEGYNANFTATVNADGTVFLACEGEEGVALTGTDGAVATITVQIAGTVTPDEYIVKVKGGTFLEEPNGDTHTDAKDREFKWTIEQGDAPGLEGDLNHDGKVDIADAVAVLDVMAAGGYDAETDLNHDQKVDIADFVAVLDIMARSGNS